MNYSDHYAIIKKTYYVDGKLRTEMFYDQEQSYKDTDELIKAIDEYINYYNNERIKSRLKGLTPIEYRNQALFNY